VRSTSLTAPGAAENRLEPGLPSVEEPSVLFPPGEGLEQLGVDPPGYFADLNLDVIVSGVVAGRDQYRLEPFFAIPLRSVESVTYRHAVMRDLERGDVFAAIAKQPGRTRARSPNSPNRSDSWISNRRGCGRSPDTSAPTATAQRS
jgi:hypothetical protein